VHDTEGWVIYVSPNPVLLVVPDGGPWVAATSYGGAKVDLCRGIDVEPGFVEFVDVELDVMWRWGEPARIEDVEEFEALGLPEAEASRLFAEADRIRACVDAGDAPFGPAFRQRLVDLAGAGDPLLQSAWATGVGPYLAGEVSELVGPEWLARQRAGEGWLLCGGVDAGVTAVVWLDAGGAEELVAAADTSEGRAMGSFLMATGPSLKSYAPPPLS
jgi:hypothetical protein